MADEKEIKNEELTDEQASCASGGSAARARFSQEVKLKPCSGPGCNKMIPDTPGINYCDGCMKKFGIQVFI